MVGSAAVRTYIFFDRLLYYALAVISWIHMSSSYLIDLNKKGEPTPRSREILFFGMK